MQGFSNRSIVVISGLLTLLVLGGTTLAVGFHHGWLYTRLSAPASAVRPSADSFDISNGVVPAAESESPSGRSTGISAQDDVAVYRQKLGEAYRALDDAYAQIRALQTPQTRLASHGVSEDRFAERDGADTQRQRRSDRHDPDDE